MSRPTQAGGETRVHLGLGSNLGNRKRNIERAVELLGERMEVERLSRLYETPPMYEERQPPFLNAVCVCASPPAPRDLLRFIQEIEASMGRVPGPRTARALSTSTFSSTAPSRSTSPISSSLTPPSPSGPSSSSPSPRSTPTPSTP